MFYSEEFRVSYERKVADEDGSYWMPCVYGSLLSRGDAEQTVSGAREYYEIRNIRVESRIVGPWIAAKEPGA